MVSVDCKFANIPGKVAQLFPGCWGVWGAQRIASQTPQLRSPESRLKSGMIGSIAPNHPALFSAKESATLCGCGKSGWLP